MRTTKPDANGATVTGGTNGKGSCYVEFGMTGRSSGTTWESALLDVNLCDQVDCDQKNENDDQTNLFMGTSFVII